MNINNLISWSAAMLLVTLAWGVTACSNDADPSPRDWTNHVPVNKDDSLAVAYIYKALDYQKWRYEGTDSVVKAMIMVDLEDYDTWRMFKLEERSGEMIVSGLDIDSENLPEGFIPDGFAFPLEFRLLQNLREVRINLSAEEGKEYTRYVALPSIFDNPIETLEISGERFGIAIPREIGKLGGTLRNLKITHTNYSIIPDEMENLTLLNDEADLTFNQFSGKVPYFPPGHPLRYCILSWNQYTEMNWEYFRDDAMREDWRDPTQKCPYLLFNPLSGMIPQDIVDSKWWMAHHTSICSFRYYPAYGCFDNCKYCKKIQR